MTSKNSSMKRLNIQLPARLKRDAEAIAAQRGESLSNFLRESISERIRRLKREEKERLLEEAYRGMAEENRVVTAEHTYIDVEGWE